MPGPFSPDPLIQQHTGMPIEIGLKISRNHKGLGSQVGELTFGREVDFRSMLSFIFQTSKNVPAYTQIKISKHQHTTFPRFEFGTLFADVIWDFSIFQNGLAEYFLKWACRI